MLSNLTAGCRQRGHFVPIFKYSKCSSCVHVSGGKLHVVSGPEFAIFPKKPTGYIIDMDSGSLSGTWNVPGGLQNPHDVAVSSDGNTVYVVELNPFKVWKLTNGGSWPRKDILTTPRPPDSVFQFVLSRLDSLLG